MATKNRTKKKTRPKRTAGKRATTMKKAVRKNQAKKKLTPNKRLSKKRASQKKGKTKIGDQKTTGPKAAGALKKQVRGKSQSVETEAFTLEGARKGEQSGDLQGLSNVQGADSESVDELLEEGNAFEAEAMKGVEDAEDANEKEVRTHEVLQDDVPGEYRDKEQ